ncbi:MAG TPA: hypothetical protein DCE41_13445 [Cytophagales bacterium]|nr:hypothetical protein [Cytophagales bacterium]HAA19585.1 hypothetical protein [Cytophagales bacterium]
MIEDVTVIIRGAYERTEAVCRQLMEQQAPAGHIHLIHEVPFSAAVRKAFEIGVAEKRPFTCCVDADVLSAPNALQDLREYMKSRKPETLMVQGLILDKLFGVIRQGGFHFYRTNHLEKAMGYLPEEGSTLRPETTLVNSMGKVGYPWVQANLISGIHDYEQFYGDLYRKCFVQSRKHPHLAPMLKTFWREYQAVDKDLQMALWGLQAGSVSDEQVFINRTQFQDEAQELLALKGWVEKGELPADFFSLEQIAAMIAEHKPEGILEKLSQSFSYRDNIDVYRYGAKKKKQSAVYRVGHLIETVGRKIKEKG